MRPVELTLDGFRSYAGPATFSWEGRRLVGIVGPIGSGKSSILDGIAFALYGKTPRVERDVRSLINQRRNEGKAALTFDVDGRRYRVVRALRRGGQSAHALYRIEDGVEVEETDRARETTERVEQLLGLDWDAFRRSVLLAQNQFAGFLEATPVQRNQVLKGVFAFEGIDAMRESVKERLDGVARDLARLTALREQAAGDREQLAAAREEHAALVARAGSLEAVAADVAAADASIAQAARTAEEADRDRRALLDVSKRLPDRTEAETVIGAADSAAAVVGTASEALAEAERRLASAREAHAGALADAGGEDALAEAARLLAVHEGEVKAADGAAAQAAAARSAADEAEKAVRAAEQASVKAVAEAAEAETTLAAAEAAASAARDRLHGARHRSMAVTLRSELAAGDTCPVCEQHVAEVPPADMPDEVADAERRLVEAELAEGAARRVATSAHAEVAAAGSRLAGAKAARDRAVEAAATAVERVRAAAGAVEATATRLGNILGEGDPAASLAARRAAVSEAAAAVEAAERARDSARAEREAAGEAQRTVSAGLAGLRAVVAAIAGRLDLDVGSMEDPAAVGAGLRAVRDELAAGLAAASDRLEAAESERRDAVAARTAALQGAGLDSDADFPAELAAARTAVEVEAALIGSLERRLADLAGLEERQQATLAEQAMLERLHGDLAPSKFQAYVLDEYRRALAELGSEHFEELSGGRYRFTDDGTFGVVDLMAAEQVRAADSLSGGETFLASLGLALALAEMVARRGGRLDAFFLDEGFGSLDTEHLDLAMEGVERLVTGADRLVVVVSHVAALRDRIEDLVVLDKDDLTGDTRVVAGSESPA